MKRILASIALAVVLSLVVHIQRAHRAPPQVMITSPFQDPDEIPGLTQTSDSERQPATPLKVRAQIQP